MQKLKSITFVLLCGLVAVGMAPSGAAKASLTFEYNATCVFNCAHISLADGAPVSGTVEFDTTNFAPGATILSGDVIDYYFEFGSFYLTKNISADQPNPGFGGKLDESASGFDRYSFTAAESSREPHCDFDPYVEGHHCSETTAIEFNYNVGNHLPTYASRYAWCPSVELPVYPYSQCNLTYQIGVHYYFNGDVIAFATVLQDATLTAVTVPEPDTVTLFGVGVLGLTLLARRRRRAA